ncbi:retinol dehydrogenase 13-like [Saccoglossus kowalevskii]|uniref:Retinol dehydrogenase 13-like n=1 Tax=Saccoglossus kowalevskii TaxID=10224 RepID=A0ABM0GRR5_SACKO|nr:PREDICTED: retinol dehydrogenase 13-like [Saccoglossus kowalevskii]
MTAALPVGVGVGAIGAVYLLRQYFKGGVCKSNARLDDKTVLITGANTGIGKETARDMARRGARVIMACRDLDKANKAADEIKQETGNENIVVKKLDLASLKSVRDLAADINKEESQLNILINNAGLMWCPRMETEDGFEMHIGVNHLGHFLLTNLLLDLIKKSSPSRIVTVSSMGHTFAKEINFDDINAEKSYNRINAYSQSKLANILFTRELSKKLQGTKVTVYSLHPGAVRTELDRYIPAYFRYAMYFLLYPILALTLKSSKDGAQTSIQCAVAEELKDVSGLYFSDCVPKQPTPAAQDDEAARKLWEVSVKMVGLEE